NQLKGNTLPFMYNDIDSLRKIIDNNKDIGVIIMEPQRTQKMSIKFLAKTLSLSPSQIIIVSGQHGRKKLFA
ncbi:MAG: hypothetical protein P8I98_07315, partial [Nitrospinaceae bacterium]|nr:hypothetical protein [Nitrospinaceae bacterium]